jgi:general secretion pathway protein A
MYEAFYGFKEKPFQLNPDPQFYFDSRQHRRAMAFLDYGLHHGEGFIVVTGEVGAGKTTLVRSLLGKLDARQVVAANIVSTNLDADDSLRMVAAAFGVATKNMPKSELLLSLEAKLTSLTSIGKRCLLIVDEAQNLTPRAVEELRMLSNFQLGTHALLQTFLVGQPEFREILQSSELHPLRQRVIAACHIGPLDPEDTRRYIEHRLQRVGWNGTPEVTAEACATVHRVSGGIPRRINLICDRVLLSGFLAERRTFTPDAVTETAAEVDSETITAPAPWQDAAARAPAGSPPNLQVAGGWDAPRNRGSEGSAVLRNEIRSVESQVHSIDHEMRELKAALARVERGNAATLGMVRRFLDWMRTHNDSNHG